MASTDEHWDPVFGVPQGYVETLFRLDGRVAAVTGGQPSPSVSTGTGQPQDDLQAEDLDG